MNLEHGHFKRFPHTCNLFLIIVTDKDFHQQTVLQVKIS